jgi:hypothetical protein
MDRRRQCDLYPSNLLQPAQLSKCEVIQIHLCADFFSTRHCEEERRGNPRYAERLCKLGIATLRSQWRLFYEINTPVERSWKTLN